MTKGEEGATRRLAGSWENEDIASAETGMLTQEWSSLPSWSGREEGAEEHQRKFRPGSLVSEITQLETRDVDARS